MTAQPRPASQNQVIPGKAPEPLTPEFISVGFIARCCGVSNTTVLRWISGGQLPAFRLPGGHYRIERGCLSEFLARHSMPGRNKSGGEK